MKRLLLLGVLLACGAQPATSPFPALPDTVYTASGATPVILVDSIKSPVPNRQVIGQYRYMERGLYVSRVVKDVRQQRKVMEHERCHIVLAETGLALYLTEDLAEMLCDAIANARVAEIERERP